MAAGLSIPGVRSWREAALVVLMLVPLALALTMAVVSKPNAHPDEINHIDAGRYYMQYWDPPKAGDPRTIESLSKYGISYLNQFESVYFVAGKVARVFSLFGLPDYLCLRLFNVGLLALLTALAIGLPGRAKVAFLPLFLSPQIWYIMSYFNGDGLPLTLSFVPVWLAARCRFPDAPATGAGLPGAEDWGDRRAWAVVLAAAAGILTCKMNYDVFVAYLFAFVLVVRAGQGAWRAAGKVALAGVVLALIGLAARSEFDHYVTDDQAGKTQAIAEQFADKDYKPSAQDIGVAHFGIHMRDMGLSYKDLFVVWDWHIWTFRTSFGTYDYMKIYAPFIYYRYMSWALIALAAAVGWGLARSGREGVTLSFLFLAFAAACVFQSTWHSWVNDFQAQGRYLFPIAAMAGLVMARFADRLGGAIVLVPAAAMYGLSLYSFVFVGLAGIPR